MAKSSTFRAEDDLRVEKKYSIMKVLERAEQEQSDLDEPRNNSNVVPLLPQLRRKQTEQNLASFETSSDANRLSNQPPFFNKPAEVVREEDTTNNSTFNGQKSYVTGTALFGEKPANSVGATLNAGSSARSLDFVTWKVDPERVEPHLAAITQPSSHFCEEYRNLRTHLLTTSEQKKLQTIVVASAGPGEGKSITAINLAWLMAQTGGLKVLLIDSDLRLPSINDYLNIEVTSGLSEVLMGKTKLPDSIVRLEPSGLFFLPGGEQRNDVAELLSGPRFKEIMNEARQMFDYIIIDAPPLGIFTDAAVLINQSDGALFVIQAGKTRYSVVNRLLETLPKQRMLGVVLNKSEEQLAESHYYYYYRDKKAEAKNELK